MKQPPKKSANPAPKNPPRAETKSDATREVATAEVLAPPPSLNHPHREETPASLNHVR